MVRVISFGNGFWAVNTWRAPVRKRLKRSTLNFAHSKRTAAQNRARVLSNNELFIFYSNNSTSFESVVFMKIVKS